MTHASLIIATNQRWPNPSSREAHATPWYQNGQIGRKPNSIPLAKTPTQRCQLVRVRYRTTGYVLHIQYNPPYSTICMPLLKEANRGLLWRKRNMPCLRHVASHHIALSRDIPLQGTSSLYSLIMSENIWPGRWLWWHVLRGHGRERRDREHPVWSMKEWSRASAQYLAAYCPLIYWSEAPSRFPLPIFNYSDITCWHELFSKLFIISRFKFILFQWNELCRFNLGLTINPLEYSNELYVSHLFLLIANDIWRARESTSIVVT